MNLHKALFLDRDGVINEDLDYVHDQANFHFIDGIDLLINTARAKDYKIIIITNQAGIGRGLYTEEDFHHLMHWLKTKLNYDAYYFCPYHLDHGIGKYKQASFDRKPNPGMILRAQKDHDIDLQYSLFIGDRESDMLAAKNAGIRTKILFNSAPAQTAADYVINRLEDAIRYL